MLEEAVNPAILRLFDGSFNMVDLQKPPLFELLEVVLYLLGGLIPNQFTDLTQGKIGNTAVLGQSEQLFLYWMQFLGFHKGIIPRTTGHPSSPLDT